MLLCDLFCICTDNGVFGCFVLSALNRGTIGELRMIYQHGAVTVAVVRLVMEDIQLD